MLTRRYCLPVCKTAVRRTSTSEQSTLIEQLKMRDPLTGEKRIGTNFNYDMELSALATRVGYTIAQLPTLPLALVHRSALPGEAKSEKDSPLHNSRLATIGESALVHFIHHYVYHTYPNLEGYMMWDINNHLTNWSAIDKVSRYLGVANLLISQHTPSEQMLGKTLLAVFGAVQIDQGLEAARSLANQFILPQLKDADLRELIKLQHPKFMLRILLKAQNKSPPVARILKETGRFTHFPTFVIGVYSGMELLGEGAGTSLRRAQDEAASTALRKHFMKEINASPFPTEYKNYKSEASTFFRVEQNQQMTA